MIANIKSFIVFTAFSATLVWFSTSYLLSASCVRNANGEITDASLSPNCTVTPDEVYFPIYKFGLCEEVPTYLNYMTACKFLYDSTTGQTVAVTSSSNFQLANNISISEGSYRAAVVLIGNTIGVLHNDVFAAPWDGLEKNGGGGYSVTNGKYCSTRLDSGSEDDFDSNLDCANSALAGGIFSETDGAYNTAGLGGRCSIAAGAISSNLTFNTASGSTTVCGMLDASTLETYTGSDTDATRQLVTQTFATAVKISPNTTSLNIAFKVTDMLSIEDVSGGGVDYIQAYLDGFEIAIDAQ